MKLLFNLLVNGFAVFVAAYLLPGVEVDNFLTAVIVAIVLGLVNAIIKPIFVLLTLPINILTIGLFTFVINALLVMLVSSIVSGFEVTNFWWAVVFSVVLSVISSFLHWLSK